MVFISLIKEIQIIERHKHRGKSKVEESIHALCSLPF